MSDWDQFGGPTNGGGFKSLEKEGDEFTGTLVRIGKAQPFEEVVPRVFFTDADGEEFHYDATLTWVRNAFLRERPEPGAVIRVWRGAKKGQQVEGGIEILSGGSSPVTATVQNSGSKAKPKAAAAKPAAQDDLPPF